MRILRIIFSVAAVLLCAAGQLVTALQVQPFNNRGKITPQTISLTNFSEFHGFTLTILEILALAKIPPRHTSAEVTFGTVVVASTQELERPRVKQSGRHETASAQQGY